MAQASVPSRQELPVEECWDLQALFTTEQDWQRRGDEILSQAEVVAQFSGRLATGPAQVAAVLAAEDKLSLLVERYLGYASFRHDQDTQDSAGLSLEQKSRQVLAKAQEAVAFIRPELVAMAPGLLEGWLQAEAQLAPYRHTLEEILRRRSHWLSPDVEAAISALGPALDGASQAASQLSNADFDFGTVQDSAGESHPLSHGRYGLYMTGQDRVLRQNSYRKVQQTYADHRHTFAATLAQTAELDATIARLRHYPSALAMRLDERSLPDEVYPTLLAAIHRSLPTLHRYLRWRKKRLGLDALHFYDLAVPIQQDPAVFSWEEAQKLVQEALAPLGESYQRMLSAYLGKHAIDHLENRGKRSGAYSSDVYDVHPYILMTFTGERQSVFTLIHELGHALHSCFSSSNQSVRNAQYPIFLAEVASTANEHLLLEHMVKHAANGQERLVLLDSLARDYLGTVYRQAFFAEFEQAFHAAHEAGQPLTAESISAIYRQTIERFYGDAVEVDAETEMEWARIPHFYFSFYVFQYATGFLAASALMEGVRRDPSAAQRYVDFLALGGSLDPLPALRKAGVDMADVASLEAGLAAFDRLVSELEASQ
ncbi:MAG: oligoendopeptidase F [Sulfobacillus sp.]